MDDLTNDLADLDEAIIAWRVSCLAEVARRDGSTSNRRLPVVVEPDDDLIDVPDYRPPRNVTVTPVPEYRPYRSRLRWVLPVVVVTCLLVGAIWLVMAIVSATVSAVAAAAPSIVSILGVVALIMLLAALGGRGGGRGFSGTFSGRMH